MGTLYVPWLADAARSTGYRVVEIAGWRTRGHGGMRVCEGVVGHHTGTPRTAAGDYPSLNVVVNGRAGLAGPLAPLGIGRDGTIYVIAGGSCYHAGASRWAGFVDLNDEFLGIEAESDGSGYWTAAQLDCYPKLVAALLRYMNRGVDRYAGHKDVCVPAGRKVDPAGIDSGWMRATAQHYLNHGIPAGDDMEASDKLRFWDGFEITVGQALMETWQLLNNLADRPTRPDKPADTTPWVKQVTADVATTRAQVAGLTDDEVRIVEAVQAGDTKVLAAIAAIPPNGAPTSAQMEFLAEYLNQRLGATLANELGQRLITPV